mgnify:CR=1 FL=1
MAQETYEAPYGELRGAGTSAGTALTTTAGFIPIPKGSHHLFMTPRNFATAVVARLAMNPWLVVLKTQDNLVTPPVDYSELAQDGDAATDVDLSDLSTLALGDFLLVGSHLPFRGVSIDVDGANANAALLTVSYWNGSAWAAISETDGTETGGTTTLAADGTVTWTIPAGPLWKAESLRDIFARVGPAVLDAVYNAPSMAQYASERMYWTRWEVDAALDAATTLNSMYAMNRSTAYFELLPSQAWSERVHRGFGGDGCIEALTDAGTGNLIVNVAAAPSGRF